MYQHAVEHTALFILLTTVVFQQSEVQGSQAQPRTSHFLFQKCVQEDLKLSKTQRDKLLLLKQDYEEAEDNPKLDDMQRLKLYKSFNNACKDVLSVEQFKRSKQIATQLKGVSSLLLSESAPELGLSKEQRQKINEIADAEFMEASKLADMSIEPSVFVERHFAICEKALEDGTAVLTERQRAKWRKIVGKQFPEDFGDIFPMIPPDW
jgi:hypothetical protein